MRLLEAQRTYHACEDQTAATMHRLPQGVDPLAVCIHDTAALMARVEEMAHHLAEYVPRFDTCDTLVYASKDVRRIRRMMRTTATQMGAELVMLRANLKAAGFVLGAEPAMFTTIRVPPSHDPSQLPLDGVREAPRYMELAHEGFGFVSERLTEIAAAVSTVTNGEHAR